MLLLRTHLMRLLLLLLLSLMGVPRGRLLVSE